MSMSERCSHQLTPSGCCAHAFRRLVCVRANTHVPFFIQILPLQAQLKGGPSALGSFISTSFFLSRDRSSGLCKDARYPLLRPTACQALRQVPGAFSASPRCLQQPPQGGAISNYFKVREKRYFAQEEGQPVGRASLSIMKTI